jgi:hypothetical protein
MFYDLCTLFGVTWLAVCYWRWLETAVGFPFPTKPWIMHSFALLFGLLIVGIASLGRDGDRLLDPLAGATISMLLLALFLFGTARRVMLAGAPSIPRASLRPKPGSGHP